MPQPSSAGTAPAGRRLPWPWPEQCPRCPSQWHRMPTTQETDGFQVKRPGDVNVKCTLLLMLDHQVRPGATWGQPGVGMGWARALDERLGMQGLEGALGMDPR